MPYDSELLSRVEADKLEVLINGPKGFSSAVFESEVDWKAEAAFRHAWTIYKEMPKPKGGEDLP